MGMGASNNRWLISSVAVIMVIIFSTITIINLREQAFQALQTQVELSKIQERANTLITLNRQAQVVGPSEGRVISDHAVQVQAELAQITTGLVQTAKDQGRFQGVTSALGHGQGTINLEQLSKEISQLDTYYGEEAQRLKGSVYIGTLLVSLGFCGLLIVLLGRFHKIRKVNHQVMVDQQALARSEDMYRGLIQMTPAAIFIQRAGKCVFVNDAGLQLLGAYADQQVLGTTIVEDYPYQSEAKVVSLERGEQPVRVEKQFSRANGQMIDVEMVILPYTYQNHPAIQIVAYDITEGKRAKERLEVDLKNQLIQKEKIFGVYRDVIYAVTQGKFKLLNHDESNQIGNEGTLVSHLMLHEPEDVSKGRQLVTEMVKDYNFPRQHVMHISLCVSETATNVIKHAGEGTLQIRRMPGKVRLVIKDGGPGMDFDKLPSMIFLKGYSTKISMGYGFSIVYKFADKIFMDTSKRGTFLALDFQENIFDSLSDVTGIIG